MYRPSMGACGNAADFGQSYKRKMRGNSGMSTASGAGITRSATVIMHVDHAGRRRCPAPGCRSSATCSIPQSTNGPTACGRAWFILELVFDRRPASPVPRRAGHPVTLRPPRPVWVDLAVVYPVSARPTHSVPDGLDLQARVPGTLHVWDLTTTGSWVGYAVFEIHGGGRAVSTSQWVPAAALSPRADAPARRTPGRYAAREG
jgi:hypothetical protein